MKHIFSYLLSILICSSGIWSNISKSFQDSIAYESSARFKWSIWDYLTNPYLYALNQKNTVSFILTDLEDFSAASSFLVYDHPVYVAMGIGSHSSDISRSSKVTNTIRHTKERSEKLNIKAMLGTVVWQNYGLGLYFDLRDASYEQAPEDIGYRQTEEVLSYIQIAETPEGPAGQKNRGSVSHLFLGLEFGEYSEAVGSVSFSVNLAYKQYGSVGKDIVEDTGIIRGENTAPFLELSTSKTFGELFPSQIHFGSFKKELDLDLLGWYVMNHFSNLGAYFEFFIQPSLDGRDSRIKTVNDLIIEGAQTTDVREEEIPSISVSSYKILLEPFYNLDFKFDFGAFRFTPSLMVSYHKESAKFDSILLKTRDGTIFNEETSSTLNLTISFQFYLNEAKTLILYAGWKPKLNLYYKKREKFENIRDLGLLNLPSPHTFAFENRRGIFDLNDSHKDISLGFQYAIIERAFFYIALSSDSVTSKFSLSQLDFGIDYQI